MVKSATPIQPSDTPLTLSPNIDSMAETARAAQSASDEAPGKTTRAFGSPRPPSAAPQIPKEFGWSHVRTHRFEEMLTGGMIINFNDRCALVLYLPILMPTCRFGEIPARGDLFNRMRTPRELGDWKDST